MGGAAGGFMGHKLGGGKLGTAGGAALGAVAMNLATNALYVEILFSWYGFRSNIFLPQ